MKHSEVLVRPVITEKGPPPADADQWKGVEGKLKHLER